MALRKGRLAGVAFARAWLFYCRKNR